MKKRSSKAPARKRPVRSSKGSSSRSVRGAAKPKPKTAKPSSGGASKEGLSSESGFVRRGSFKWLQGKRKAKLKTPVVYMDRDFGPIEVPVGFVTDFASIPRPLWKIDSPIEHDIVLPSVVHDWLYFIRGSTGISRKQADDVFYRAMRDENAPLWKAWGRYWAVRIGSRWSKGWPKGMEK